MQAGACTLGLTSSDIDGRPPETIAEKKNRMKEREEESKEERDRGRYREKEWGELQQNKILSNQ